MEGKCYTDNKTGKEVHTYSRSMEQEYPRKCIYCGKKEIRQCSDSGRNAVLGDVLTQMDYWLSNGTLLSRNEIDKLKEFLSKYFA